jgi:hypothetical protein
MKFLAHVRPFLSDGSRVSRRLVAAATGLTLLAGGNLPAMAQDDVSAAAVQDDVPVMARVVAPPSTEPSSTEQGAVPIDQSNLANPPLPAIFKPEEKPELAPFFRDTTFGAQARSYFLNRRKFDSSYQEAWALGGSLAYLSGYLADHFRVGAVGYTSQRLYGPEDKDGTLLLEPDQQGYTVLGQIYGEIRFTDQLSAAFGKKEYNTPFINKNDVRMTPNTFQGYSLYGTAGGEDGAPAWRYGAGYINKIKERNSDEFVWMSKDAGANVDRGVYAAGVNYKQGDFWLGAFNYYSNDIINIFYGEAKYALPLTDNYKLQLSAQYTNQRSTGDDLLKGHSFSTGQGGVKADLGVGGALLTLAYTSTANGLTMQNPWSSYPGYTSVQVQDFDQAGESAVMLRAEYDFSKIGYEGLSAYALFVQGTGVKGSSPNENETDLNLQWVPKNGALKNFSFRTRYAVVEQRGSGGGTLDDFRFIVNYNF